MISFYVMYSGNQPGAKYCSDFESDVAMNFNDAVAADAVVVDRSKKPPPVWTTTRLLCCDERCSNVSTVEEAAGRESNQAY